MKISEILLENTSKDTALRNITDILTVRLPALYSKLLPMAEKYYNNHGEIDGGFAFISGGQKAAWYNDVYTREMNPTLYALIKYYPGQSSALKEFMQGNVGGKFSSIERSLLGILRTFSERIGSRELQSAVATSEKAVSNYYAKLDNMSADDRDDDAEKVPVNKEKSSLGNQQNAVQIIINDVLSRPEVKKYAGEIRGILARSENKLMTLKAELGKRGIKI